MGNPVNIQINGDVHIHGDVHIYNGGGGDGSGRKAIMLTAAVLEWALVKSAHAVAIVTACSFWLLARTAQGILVLERGLGGGPRQLTNIAMLPRDSRGEGLALRDHYDE